jgi:hypothetical protein
MRHEISSQWHDWHKPLDCTKWQNAFPPVKSTWISWKLCYSLLDLRFSYRWLWRVLPSGMMPYSPVHTTWHMSQKRELSVFTINNTKFPHIVMITIKIHKTLLFTSVHNMFRSVSSDGSDMNRTSTQFNFNLTGKGSKICHPWLLLGLPRIRALAG